MRPRHLPRSAKHVDLDIYASSSPDASNNVHTLFVGRPASAIEASVPRWARLTNRSAWFSDAVVTTKDGAARRRLWASPSDANPHHGAIAKGLGLRCCRFRLRRPTGQSDHRGRKDLERRDDGRP